jgi:PEGA domain
MVKALRTKSSGLTRSGRLSGHSSTEHSRETDMAIQYLLVTYPEQRAVLVDGAGIGFTNHTLMLPADEYTITLDGTGYLPGSQPVVLSGTSIIKPKVVAFLPISGATAPAPATARATPAAAARRKSRNA